MNLGETEPVNAFGGYPFDASAVRVGGNPQPKRHPVSKFMAPCPGATDVKNCALVPSPPPLGTSSKRANWPPSIRREEAKVLSDLKKRVGFYRVRNTSTFKKISPPAEKDAELDSDGNDSDSSASSDADNRIFLRKMLSNRPLNRLSNISDTNTDWYTSDFVTECLCWHNVYRQRHGSPPLTLSPDLCTYAQEWANTLAHMNIFFYRPNAHHVGQNIYCRLNVKEPADVRGLEVASYWYKGCRHYNFMKEPEVLHANVNASHFAQVVWASSSDIGIGIAKSRMGKLMVVANYRPRGNVPGRFQDNVFPPVEDGNGKGRGGVRIKLARLFPNIGGPSGRVRQLYSNVVHSVFLYGAPIWAEALGKDRRGQRLLDRAQGQMCLRLPDQSSRPGPSPGWHPAARSRCYWERSNAVQAGAEDFVRASRPAAQAALLGAWRERIRAEPYGPRVLDAVEPYLEDFVSKSAGKLSFRTTQLFSGHGCFVAYLYEIGREETPQCWFCGAASQE